MATIDDIGVPGQTMDTPPLTEWQAAIRDAVKAQQNGDVWTPWTPTPTACTLQASSCFYRATPGGLVSVTLTLTIATMGTNPQLTLPPGLTAASVQPISAMLFSAGTNYWPAIAYVGGNLQVYCHPTTAGGPQRSITATAPFTWKATDQLYISGSYRKA